LINASKNKNKKHAVKKALGNFEESVQFVRELLVNKSYVPNTYYPAKITDGLSKKERTIYKPKFFPDQVIHWCLINIIRPLIMRGMYHWSCASIPGRGPHYAKKACERWIRHDYKNTRYCLKLDIRKYYPSVDRERLKDKFRRFIKDKDTLWLIDEVIDSHRPGLPIGNYTSQWFANFYLQDADHYIKEELRIKHYIRYMDDLVLFGPNKRKLRRKFRLLRRFLKNEGLRVKGNWQIFNVSKRHLDFCGFCFGRDKTYVRKRITKRMRRRYFSFFKNPSKRKAASLMSYYGWLKCTDSYILFKKYFSKINIIKEFL
jgi:hypothetical protein